MNAPGQLIDLYLDDQLDDDQGVELRAWLESDPEHLREFLRRTALHHALRAELRAAQECDRYRPADPAAMRPLSARRRRVLPLRQVQTWRWVALAVAACLVAMIALPHLMHSRATDDGVVIAAGEVAVERHGSLLILHVGDPLADGDALHADGQHPPQVRFADGTTLSLDNGTKLTLIARGGGDTPGKRLALDHGRIVAEVVKQPPGRPLVITSIASEATVVGTEFTLACASGRTRLEVTHGLVRLARLAGGEALVAAGEYAEAASDLAPVARALNAAGGSSATSLRVGGLQHNQIVGTDGRRFVIKGAQLSLVLFFRQIGSAWEARLDADHALYERAFNQREEQFRALRANGVNTLRIFVSGEIARDPNNGYRSATAGLGGFDGYVQRLVAYANAARDHGFHVLFCYAGDDAWANDAHWPIYQQLMGALMAGLRDNPDVFYELVQQPDLPDQDWARLSNRTIDFYRAHGYTGPLVVGLNHLCNWWYAPVVEQVARHDGQLIFSLHWAKWVGWERTAEMLRHGSDHPLLLGELAREVNGDIGEEEALSAADAMRGLVEQGLAVGVVANGWNCRDVQRPRGNQMTDDEAAVSPNSWGVGFREHFSGRLADWLDPIRGPLKAP